MIPLAKNSCYFLEKKFFEANQSVCSVIHSQDFQNSLFKIRAQLSHLSEQPIKLHDYCIEQLTRFDKTLDHALPNWIFQSVMDKAGQNIEQKIDQVGQYIRAQLGIHVSFNEWLNKNNGETWYEQLDIYLCKLPLKMIYNVVSLLSHIIGSVCYSAIHPLKALNHLAQFLLHVAYAFTLPETWCLFGAGMITSSAGQSLASGNPLLLLGIVIGSALAAGGFGLSVLKATVAAEEGTKLKAEEAAAKNLLKQVTETMLQSFCMGLLIGKIQQATDKRFKQSLPELQRQYADDFLKNNPHFGRPSHCEIDSSGRITFTFEKNRYWEIKLEPILENDNASVRLDNVFVHLLPDGTVEGNYLLTTRYGWNPPHTQVCRFTPVDQTMIAYPGQVGVAMPKSYGAVLPQTAITNHLAKQAIIDQTGGVMGTAIPTITEASKAS